VGIVVGKTDRWLLTFTLFVSTTKLSFFLKSEYIMPSRKRFYTRYPGIFYVESTSKLTGKQEKVYFIMYRKDGKKVERKSR